MAAVSLTRESVVWWAKRARRSAGDVETAVFFFSSRRRHTRSDRDWSSDVCSSDLPGRAVTERKHAEAELERHRAQLRGLAARLEAAREAERARIAREIHDELGQALDRKSVV